MPPGVRHVMVPPPRPALLPLLRRLTTEEEAEEGRVAGEGLEAARGAAAAAATAGCG